MANKPKPKELKVLQGTFRKDRETVENAPEYKAIKKVPDAPLSIRGIPELEKKWKEIGDLLVESGVLKHTDIDILESYCLAWYSVVLASKDVIDEGVTIKDPIDGSIKKNPASTALFQAQAEHRQLSTLLGLNPSARTRINVGKKETKPEGLSALRK